MIDNNKKQIVVVTGVTGCMGSSITEKMINEGYFVVGIGRNKTKGEKMCKKMGKRNFVFYSIDTGLQNEVHELFKSKLLDNNRLKAVITCAGILKMENTDKFDFNDWNNIINTNLSGTFYFLKEALRIMKNNKNGMIIPIGSRWGISGANKAAAYSASKSALRALVKSIQLECVNTQVRCILVSPGSVASNMSNYVKNDIQDKLLDAEDIANIISYIINTPSHVIFDEIVIKAYPYDVMH